MLKFLINNFKITNNCIIVATPLILFLSLLGLYVNYAGFAIDNPLKLYIAFVTFFIMFSGFLSAWLYMVKKALVATNKIYVFEKDRIKAILELFCTLPKGIGRLMLPITTVIAIYIIINLIMYSGLEFTITRIVNLAQYWIYMLIAAYVLLTFMTLFWIPEIVYNEKNALIALYNSMCKVFFNFYKSLLLYLYIIILICFAFLLYLNLSAHPIITFFILILFYYILVYVVVLLFTYYEQTFIKQ